jgi:hypothetical protein
MNRAITTPLLQDGSTCLMWYDRWNDSVLHHSYPELFSYAKNRVISVSAAASVPLVQDLFHLPLSNEAYLQF